MPLPHVTAVPVPGALDADVVVLGLRPPRAGDGGPALLTAPRAAARAAASLGVNLSRLLTGPGAPTARAGDLLAVPVSADGPVRLVLLVGTGDGSLQALRRTGAAVARRVAGHRRVLVLLGPAAGPDAVAAFAEGLSLAAYRVPRRGVEPGPAPSVQVGVRSPGSVTPALQRVGAIAAAVHLARDLANTPADLKSPAWLAGRARAVARSGGLTVAVRDERALVREGFGGLLAVGGGSARPPRLVEVGYRPDGAGAPHVVLVGKGIVFDSGGLSIKPARGMDLMKTDMAGAAAVLGVLAALPVLRPSVRVTGLLAVAENLPSGSAWRPSDVVVPYGGELSVEVVNTDAEGRMVLADGLAYARLCLQPDVVVDVATLTGAATSSLGRRDAPLYATDDRLAAALARAAAVSGERVWRMPLDDDLRPALDSDVADLRHAVTTRGVGAGSTTAALFLREFAVARTGLPWAHLDIAGTGRADGEDEELTKGATGFGVRLLLAWLASGRLR